MDRERVRPSSFVSSYVGLLDCEAKQQHSEEAALLRPLVGAQNFQNLMGRSAEKKRGRARVGPMSKAPEGIEIFLLEEGLEHGLAAARVEGRDEVAKDAS